MSDNYNNAIMQISVSVTECIDPDVTEIMDATEEWVDTENINSNNLNVQGPKYFHPHNDRGTRHAISSKEAFKEIYPECFSGVGKFNNYMYHIELDPKVKPVIHPVRKIAISLQPKLEKELDEMVKHSIIAVVD